MVTRVTVTVRPARREDAITMARLAQLAYAPYVSRVGREPAPMKADYAKIIDDGYAWVAERRDRLVGLLVLQPGEDHMMLENVAVAPEVQGLGVGARLLRLAEEQAQEQGLPEVRLYTNEAMTENLTYYPRHGYRETHRSTQDGYHRVFFTKAIARSTPEPAR